MNKAVKIKRYKKTVKAVILTVLAIAAFSVGSIALAQCTGSGGGIGGVASQITGSFGNLAKLITAGAYVGGFGFAVGAILKFKAHKDNPTQIPVGTPIALIFIAAALIFLPSIFGVAGQTLFGSTTGAGGVSGTCGIGGT